MKIPPRTTMLAACVGVALLAMAIYSADASSSASRRLEALRAQHKELRSMRGEFLVINERVRAFETKLGHPGPAGIQQGIGEVLGSVGLKDKIKSIKNIDSNGGEKAELSIKRVSMNEMVNILYAFENAPMPLVVRAVEIKNSFQRHGLLDMTLTLALVKAE